MAVYFDTNIFIHSNDTSTLLQKECSSLMDFLNNQQIGIYTSCETIQEIINWSTKNKIRSQGIAIAKTVSHIVDLLIPVSEITIEIFLNKCGKYQLNHSRDILHLSSSLQTGTMDIITYDTTFQNFTEIRSFTPTQYIQAFI